jgi:nicotinate-nucleotide pyrophosphorylase (carboxylating)
MANWNRLCNQILQELEADRVQDDVTARLLEGAGKVPGRGVVRAKAAGVFSGKAAVHAIADVSGLDLELVAEEGKSVSPGSELVRLSGHLDVLLGVERTLLNLTSHLSGVATLTRKYVDAIGAYPVRLLATRKFLPGLRDLQLQAVRAGGGHVHRRSLSDGILIKENHQEIVPGPELLRRARRTRSPLHRIEIEVQSIEGLKEVMAEEPDVVMLDNFSLAQMKEAVGLIAGRCEIEVSGGVDLESIGAIAALGVQYVSVGRITHSAPSLDMSMDVERG